MALDCFPKSDHGVAIDVAEDWLPPIPGQDAGASKAGLNFKVGVVFLYRPRRRRDTWPLLCASEDVAH